MGGIDEGGTIDDLVADAAALGFPNALRLIRRWTEQGLLDYPQSRPDNGHGSAPALYSAGQRNLLRTLLQQRPGNHIRTLAQIPVVRWAYWRDDWVPVSQARRAFMTWVGDAHASKRRAHEAAQVMLGQIDNPHATLDARYKLRRVVEKAAYAGHRLTDQQVKQVEGAIQDVVEPPYGHIRKGIGRPPATLLLDSMITGMNARLTAVKELRAGNVTDGALIRAADTNVFLYADRIDGAIQLYPPVTASMMWHNCCFDLLTIVGLEIKKPGAVERRCRARSFRRRPAPEELGLIWEQLGPPRQ